MEKYLLFILVIILLVYIMFNSKKEDDVKYIINDRRIPYTHMYAGPHLSHRHREERARMRPRVFS